MIGPQLSTEVVREAALQAGVCVRPIIQRVTDTSTGEVRMVAIQCGSTKTRVCPPCADRAQKLRMHQCREGWHLTAEPPRPDGPSDGEGPEDGEGGVAARRVRSTRHRQDMAKLPRRPMSERTIGETFTDRKTGKTYRPSMFLTLTLDSYGRVRDDGTPVNPATYDYRRAALDALHFSKLVDRFFQNLRRCAGYDVQYFATIEEQRRLAPHLHAALRGAIPRDLLRQVAAATYHQVWWPAHQRPVYAPGEMPTWSERHGRYVDAQGRGLPTWDEALDELGADPNSEPAHVVRFGAQVKPKGIIPGPEGERTIGYLCKYLPKNMGTTYADDDELTPCQAAHLDRLHQEIRRLPCSPECANWLAYGIQPDNPRPDVPAGACTKAAHDRDNAGLGGRRVLVSRRWTGKTLTRHRADRAAVVRAVLEEAGVNPDDHEQLAAHQPDGDGQPRWRWEPLSARERSEVTYLAAIRHAIKVRHRWRTQYDHARTVIAARASPGPA